MIKEDVIILNSRGEVYQVIMQFCHYGLHTDPMPNSTNADFYYFPDPDNREWPEDLKGDITVLFSITETYLWEGIPHL